MLPNWNLDDENFDQIVEEAKNRIRLLYPDWTDYNYHDPGITLLELFAWMKENQQYYLNQISDGIKRKFLKLLGMRQEHRKPAVTCLQVACDKNRALFRGAKAWCREICFETETKKQLVGEDILFLLSMRDSERMDYAGKNLLSLGQRIRFYPFGQSPVEGDCCYIALENPFPAGEEADLYLDIWEEYRVRRNPISDTAAVSLAAIELQYLTADGWKSAGGLADNTYGCLQDGFLRFYISEQMERGNVGGQSAYFLRLVLVKQEYDIPPCITRAAVNIISIRQIETLSEFQDFPVPEESSDQVLCLDSYLSAYGRTQLFFGTGGVFREIGGADKAVQAKEGQVTLKIPEEHCREKNGVLRIVNREDSFASFCETEANGMPDQRIRLEDAQIVYETFELMIWEEKTGGYRKWNKVYDFSSSAAGSRHYVLEEESGILRFGDGIRGRMPKGRIYLLGYARTMGESGNVKENRVNRLSGDSQTEEMKVWNIENAEGGREKESLENCFLRAERRFEQPETAVTDRDYEKRVREAPGMMIEACRVIRDRTAAGLIRIAVKPYHPENRMTVSSAYRKNIRAYLERFRVIGSRIEFIQPEYIPVHLRLELVQKSRYQDVREQVRKVLKDYFDRVGTSFGTVLSYGEVYDILNRLPGISNVRTLFIEADSDRVRYMEGGDIELPPNGIAYMEAVLDRFLMED